MEKKKISVLMTVYKENEEELKESFESIINQTYKNLEIIIVIDSPDESWRKEFIEKYNDKRVKLIINEKNIGLPLSLNKAIKIATGDYYARMDADDISTLDRFEKQLKYIEEENCDLVGSYMQYFYEGKDQQLGIYPIKSENIYKLLKYKSCVLHPTWFAKPEVFKKLNGYRNIFSCEDYDFLLRASLSGFKLANYPEVLYKCRLSPNSISRSNTGRQELISELLRSGYRKGKIISEQEIENFINSEKYEKRIKSYNNYGEMKNKRARYRANKFPMFYIYSILLLLNLKYSIKDTKVKIYNKYILLKDKK